jgi:hypothetical protein
MVKPFKLFHYHYFNFDLDLDLDHDWLRDDD